MKIIPWVDVNEDTIVDQYDLRHLWTVAWENDHRADKFRALLMEQATEKKLLDSAGNLMLTVPYRGQHDSDSGDCYSLNCGPACVSMVLQYYGTIEPTSGVRSVLDRCGYTSIRDMYRCAVHFRPDLSYECRKFTPTDREHARQWMIENLRQGNPIILLVVAARLPQRGYRYRAGHFVCLYGVSADETKILMHDPNNTTGRTRGVYPIEDVLNAWWMELGGYNALAIGDY